MSKIGRPVGRLVTGVALAFALAALNSPTAQAQVPDHGTYEYSASFDDPDYCASDGFTFHVEETGAGHYVVTFDKDGTIGSVLAHHAQTDVFTANGKTLTESDTWTDMYYADGTSQTVGNHTHIQGPTGIVLLDAGRLKVDADGNLVQVSGPHPQYFGETFCKALLP